MKTEQKAWSITDAKVGDVLVEDKISGYPSPFIAIFKTKDSVDTFSSHCFIGFDGNFYEGEARHCSENIHPATKEQRDLLFQKMKEARYKWNPVRKELKKIGNEIEKQWKPSEEQMKALANALSLAKNCGEESAFDLRTLYEQLKKLREE